MRRIHPLLTLLMLYAGAAAAFDKEGNYAVWGTGQRSCNMYNQARSAGDYGEYKTYMMGYLTAYHTFTPDTYRVGPDMDMDALLAWLDTYCKATALDSFDRALKAMVDNLVPTRQRQAPGNRAGW